MPDRARLVPLIVAAACLVAPPASGQQAPTAPGGPSLADRVRSVLETPGYAEAHWGLLVVDAADGRTIYEREADRLFGPASVTKLFTTAAALADLGADHRFQTPVVRRGEVDAEGTLRGDLILIAQGDPCLGGRTGPEGTLLYTDDDHIYAGGSSIDGALVPTDPVAGLDHLARQVREAGIKAISGDVLVDDRLFERAASSGSGPDRVSPIVVNDNLIDVVVSPGAKAGEPAKARIVPETSFASMDVRVATGDPGSEPHLEVRPVGPRRFRVLGSLPVGHRPVVRIYVVEEPAAFARSLLIEALRRREVRVDASPLAENRAEVLPSRGEVGRLPKVAEYISPPFREYLKVILKVSHNLHASTLPLLIASHHGETTLKAGLRREGQTLKDLGVDPSAVSFGGGAGGERADLVTPRATVALLRAMAARPDASAFQDALPVLGRDGTLAKAVGPESPARGHAQAKTGTYWVINELTGKPILTSKALAGYLETASGRSLVFAFFLNDVPIDAPAPKVTAHTAAAGRLLGRLCETFYADAPVDAPAPASGP